MKNILDLAWYSQTNSQIRISRVPLNSLFISKWQDERTQSKLPLDASGQTYIQPSFPSRAGAMFVLRGILGESKPPRY